MGLGGARETRFVGGASGMGMVREGGLQGLQVGQGMNGGCSEQVAGDPWVDGRLSETQRNHPVRQSSRRRIVC